MPQLDGLTFLSQFSWLLLFFLVLYFRVVLVYLPPLAEVLKLRKKTKEQDVADIELMGDSRKVEAVSYEDSLKQCMEKTHLCFQDGSDAASKQAEQAFVQVNKTSLKQANQLYLSTLSTLGLNQVLGSRLVAGSLSN
jgi:F0F1-type ATP synthase membrane subunit b/b'